MLQGKTSADRGAETSEKTALLVDQLGEASPFPCPFGRRGILLTSVGAIISNVMLTSSNNALRRPSLDEYAGIDVVA